MGLAFNDHVTLAFPDNLFPDIVGREAVLGGEHWNANDGSTSGTGADAKMGDPDGAGPGTGTDNGISCNIAQGTRPGPDSICKDADRLGGAGGKGFRHYFNEGAGAGGWGVGFIPYWTATTEIWIRYYLRFKVGLGWDSVTPGEAGSFKTFYNNGTNTQTYFGFINKTVGFHCANDTNDNLLSTDVTYGLGASGATWANTFTTDGTFSNGSWHCIEWHFKLNQNPSFPTITADGVGEFWVDDVLQFSRTDMAMCNEASVTWPDVFMSNNSACISDPAVDGWADIDDFVISNTGYIGPVAAASSRGSFALTRGIA